MGYSSWQQSVNTLLATWQVLNVPLRAICLLARIHLTSPPASPRLVAFASSRIIPKYIYRKSESLSLFLATSMQFSGIFGESKLCCGPAGLKFTARPQTFLAAISNNCLHLIAAASEGREGGQRGRWQFNFIYLALK